GCLRARPCRLRPSRLFPPPLRGVSAPRLVLRSGRCRAAPDRLSRLLVAGDHVSHGRNIGVDTLSEDEERREKPTGGQHSRHRWLVVISRLHFSKPSRAIAATSSSGAVIHPLSTALQVIRPSMRSSSAPLVGSIVNGAAARSPRRSTLSRRRARGGRLRLASATWPHSSHRAASGATNRLRSAGTRPPVETRHQC